MVVTELEVCACGETRVVVVAFASGWRVSCGQGHELFPHPTTTIVARVESLRAP